MPAAPYSFRIGDLITRPEWRGLRQSFIDVRNLAFDEPKGSICSGSGLDPVNGKLGSVLLVERDFILAPIYGGTSRRSIVDFATSNDPPHRISLG